MKTEKEYVIPHPSVTPQREGLSWKLNFLLIAVLASSLVGLGLHLGRDNKKDDHTARVLQTNRSADNDATRASTERVLVDGVIKNEEKVIATQGQVANRIVDVQESAESRQSRELEYRANAGTELLRQQQERLKIANEQLQWERRQYEEAQSIRQSQANIAADRMRSIQLMIADGRISEARGYARSREELAVVESAERSNDRRPRRGY